MNTTTENNLTGRGYIFVSAQHGAFDPNGKIDASAANILAHNAELARAEMAQLKETGAGILYLFSTDGVPSHVGTWASAPAERIKLNHFSKGKHNIARQRLDVWFYLEGKCYHGVNIGDNDIVRVKRNKS